MISIHYLLSGQKERRSTQLLLCDMVHMNDVNAITRKKVWRAWELFLDNQIIFRSLSPDLFWVNQFILPHIYI